MARWALLGTKASEIPCKLLVDVLKAEPEPRFSCIVRVNNELVTPERQ